MKLRVDRLKGRLVARAGGIILAALAPGSAILAAPHDPAPPPVVNGPAADYPIVLGAPFVVDGITYSPSDTMNYDSVGYAITDPAAGAGVSIAHRTLPLPSYAEVTSLQTGRTILVRVERRGPMSGSALVALSPGASAQLGSGGARTPIRIRRVNPPEVERALLRAHQQAPARMDTPMSLVGVLMRKLEPVPVAPLPVAPAPIAQAPVATMPTTSAPITPAVSPAAGKSAKPVPAPLPAPLSTKPVLAPAPVAAPKTASAPKKPAVMPPQLRPISPATVKPATPPVAPATAKPAPAPKPAPAIAARTPASPVQNPAAAKGRQAVQVGAFSTRERAQRAASQVGGTVAPAGKLFRVRIEGLADAPAASAALAKAKAAGYSDARIQPAD